ncbi:MAG: RNA polymerase sigma factor [Gammaproteobacteria bacterium]|nr:RNA polymerase sigma factor [Gammaproteobacteria bacterium]
MTAVSKPGVKSEPAEAITEMEQVRRAQQGDVAAYEALYRMHIGRIYALCLRMTGNRATAEDCAQDAFIRAWRKLAQFRGTSAFGTWLHRIAINEVLTRRRSAGRERAHMELVDNEQQITRAERRGNANEHRLDLEQAIAALPEGARHVFVMHSVYGYSHEETAGTLGVAVGTCKAQLHRARKLLRANLDA